MDITRHCINVNYRRGLIRNRIGSSQTIACLTLALPGCDASESQDVAVLATALTERGVQSMELQSPEISDVVPWHGSSHGVYYDLSTTRTGDPQNKLGSQAREGHEVKYYTTADSTKKTANTSTGARKQMTNGNLYGSPG